MRLWTLGRSRPALVKLAILVLPLVALFFALRFAAPALERWSRTRLAGKGYETVAVTGRGARFELTYHASRAEVARQAVAFVDSFVAEMLAAGRSSFALAAPDGPIRLLVFAQRADLEGYVGVAFEYEFRFNAGFYDPRSRTIGLVEEGDLETFYRGLRHETAHLLFDLAASARGLSVWLAEGLAVHFERDDPSGRPGALDPRLLASARACLERGEPLRLREAIEAEGKSFRTEGNERYYRGSALIAGYLLEGAPPELRARFLDFVRLELADGPSGLAGFERCVAPLATLEPALAAWVSRGAPLHPERR